MAGESITDLSATKWEAILVIIGSTFTTRFMGDSRSELEDIRPYLFWMLLQVNIWVRYGGARRLTIFKHHNRFAKLPHGI